MRICSCFTFSSFLHLDRKTNTMAPKKGKKEGGKKKKDGAPPILEDEKETKDKVPENSREFYLIQIKDLESRLMRFQQKVYHNETRSQEIQSMYEKIQEENGQKNDYFTDVKKKLEKERDEYKNYYFGTVQTNNAQKDQFEKQLGLERQQNQETLDKKSSEIAILNDKVDKLEHFEKHQKEYLAEKERLIERIRTLDDEYEGKLSNLEKKQIIDRFRLKKEIVSQVNHVAAEFRKVSNKQMAETTKRTIRENVAVSEQLHKLSDQAKVMIDENDRLKHQLKEAKMSVELLQENEKIMATKNVSAQEIISMLTNKLQDMEETVENYRLREEEAERLKLDFKDQEDDLTNYTLENDELRDTKRRLQKENEELRKTLEDQSREHKQIKKLLTQTALTVKEALVQPPSGLNPDTVAMQAAEQRENIVQKMFMILNVSTLSDAGCTPAELAPLRPIRSNARSRRGSASDERPDSSTLPQLIHAAHDGRRTHAAILQGVYRPGDLGIVPGAVVEQLPTSGSRRALDGYKMRSLHGAKLSQVTQITRLGHVQRRPLQDVDCGKPVAPNFIGKVT